MLLIKKPFLQLPWLISNCQWGLLGFASKCYHYGWKENQTSLYLTDALPSASAWQAECTTQLLHFSYWSPQSILLLTRVTLFTIEFLLLLFNIGVSNLCYICKKIRTECATWNLSMEPLWQNHFFSFNLQTFFPVGTWNGVSQKWNTKTFPEQGRHFRYLQLPTMVEAICKYKKERIIRIGLYHIHHNGLAFSGWFREQ